MRHVETSPGWALRLRERCRQRHAGDRIARWISLPTQKARTHVRAQGLVSGPDSPDAWSNDNLIALPARAAG